MKWVKHITKSKYDPKIMRIVKKHGIAGYGIYWAIIEWIANQLEPEKPTPDLEQESRDIADFFNMDIRKVDEIVKDCITERLLQYNKETSRIECFKVLTHLDNTLSNNPQIRLILDNFNKLEVSASRLDYIRLDKHRLDKIKKEKGHKHKYMEFVTFTTVEYFKLIDLYGKQGVRDKAYNLNLYKQSTGKKYASDYATILTWDRKEKFKQQSVGNVARKTSKDFVI